MNPRKTQRAAEDLAGQIENPQDIKRVFNYLAVAMQARLTTLQDCEAPDEDVRMETLDALNFITGKLEIFIDTTC